MQDLDVTAFDSFVLKAMLRGKENMEIYSVETKASRKVMTLALLRVLGHELSISGWSENSKQVIWGAFTLAFFRSFRLGEILPQNEKSFCPNDTLLWEDVKLVLEDHFIIHFKTKSRLPEGEFVDIFSFEGYGVCPVKSPKETNILPAQLPTKFSGLQLLLRYFSDWKKGEQHPPQLFDTTHWR